MPVRYLLDTDTWIYLRERRRAEVIARFGRAEAGAVGVSVITYGELMYGAEKSARRAEVVAGITEIASIIPVLPLPPEAGAAYGAFRADLQRKGAVMIGNNDLWIAAHAHAADLVLVTNNEREFRRIPGLRLENWVA
jgi:tRNA(fMet)-specific endonuclease VapC